MALYEVDKIYQKIGEYYLPISHNPDDRNDYIFTGTGIPDGETFTTSISGRRMYVNRNIDCVCIEFDYWGETKTLQVPFAKYRTIDRLKFGTSGLDVPELDNDDYSSAIYINGANVSHTASVPAITDESLQSRFARYKTDKTGKENTDIWMQYVDYTDNQSIVGVPAVQACRNTSTKGIIAGYFDCPNVYELAIAWIESDNIDLLDPTADEYPDRKLGKANPSGRFFYNYIWASTESNTSTVRLIHTWGGTNRGNKYFSPGYYILPCKVV